MIDTKGREWDFRFTARTVRDLAAETKLDTKALTGPRSLLEKFGSDEETLLLVLWITIRPRAMQLNVTENDWLESLDNDNIEQAASEWMEAYTNFSQPARKAILKKSLDYTTKKRELANQQLEKMLASGEIDAKIEDEIDKALEKLHPSIPSTSTAASSQVSSE